MEEDSWLYNFIFSLVSITRIFEEQTKKRLNLKIQFKIEFLLPFTDSRKVLEKMPGKCEISQSLKYLKNTYKGVHIIFVVGIEF